VVLRILRALGSVYIKYVNMTYSYSC